MKNRSPFMLKKLSMLLLMVLLGVPAHADYFLHGAQRADLITHGEINGEDGARYSVWIVPGYSIPAHNAAQGWRAAGDDLDEYRHHDLYAEAVRTSKKIFRFGTRTTLREFALKGTHDAWGNALDMAGERTRKRVFGWWFAYPWAVIEAGTESVVRVGLGVPGGIIIAGVAVTAAPVIAVALPAAKAVYHGSIPGTVMPVAAGAWNTMIAPPMALLGQQPSESRSDGFWLKRMDPAKTDAEWLATGAALTAWRTALVNAPQAQAVMTQEKEWRESYDKKRDAMLKALHSEFEENQSQVNAQWQQAVEAQAALHPDFDRNTLAARVQRYGRQPAIDALTGSGISREMADRLLSRLIGEEVGAKVLTPQEQRRDEDKTDPLKRSLQLDSTHY